jgi:hypothetical protein
MNTFSSNAAFSSHLPSILPEVLLLTYYTSNTVVHLLFLLELYKLSGQNLVTGSLVDHIAKLPEWTES